MLVLAPHVVRVVSTKLVALVVPPQQTLPLAALVPLLVLLEIICRALVQQHQIQVH